MSTRQPRVLLYRTSTPPLNEPMSHLLTFEQADLPDEGYDCPARSVSFRLAPGDWVDILLETEIEHPLRTPLMDAAHGLLAPAAGRVLFQDEDWSRMHPDRQAEQRARIGRVFLHHEAWLSNLDVDENITLRVRHRTNRAPHEILEQARALALEIGLGQLPAGRPATMHRDVLQQCQWVRALLDAPPLLLAEAPAAWLDRTTRQRVAGALEKRRAQGMAVLCFSTDPHAWRDVSRASRRLMFHPATGTCAPLEPPPATHTHGHHS